MTIRVTFAGCCVLLASLAVLVRGASAQSKPAAKEGSRPTAAALVGTWRLVSFARTDLTSGVTTDVFGKSPTGLLTYTADGHVQVILVKEGRPKPDLTKMTDAERAALFQDMVAYAG